ncbi:MAG TPA: hypothetical protein VHE35_22515, partial [Kofleriaceae bacterium]|nr:hypothetical protein [Kofleriaceae bacterium]
ARSSRAPVARRRGAPVPAALETVIATAMAKDPAERYRVATAFGKARDAIELGRWTAPEAAAWWTAARLTPVSARRRASSASRAVTVDAASGTRTPPEPS